MRQPAQSSGSDDADQITGDALNQGDLEIALGDINYDYICFLSDENERKQIADILDYYAQRDLFQRRFENTQPSPIWFHTVTGTIKVWAAIEPYIDNVSVDQKNRINDWFRRRMDELIHLNLHII